jgi:hypothetical protein
MRHHVFGAIMSPQGFDWDQPDSFLVYGYRARKPRSVWAARLKSDIRQPEYYKRRDRGIQPGLDEIYKGKTLGYCSFASSTGMTWPQFNGLYLLPRCTFRSYPYSYRIAFAQTTNFPEPGSSLFRPAVLAINSRIGAKCPTEQIELSEKPEPMAWFSRTLTSYPITSISTSGPDIAFAARISVDLTSTYAVAERRRVVSPRDYLSHEVEFAHCSVEKIGGAYKVITRQVDLVDAVWGESEKRVDFDISPSGKQLAFISGEQPNEVRLYDLSDFPKSIPPPAVYCHHTGKQVYSVSFSPDGLCLAVLTRDPKSCDVTVFDMEC